MTLQYLPKSNIIVVCTKVWSTFFNDLILMATSLWIITTSGTHIWIIVVLIIIINSNIKYVLTLILGNTTNVWKNILTSAFCNCLFWQIPKSFMGNFWACHIVLFFGDLLFIAAYFIDWIYTCCFFSKCQLTQCKAFPYKGSSSITNITWRLWDTSTKVSIF